MSIKKFDLGREHNSGIGMVGIVEQPNGNYMLVADHERLIRACESLNEMHIARSKKAETELHDLKKHLGKLYG